MVRDLFDPRRRHPPATQHIAQKRPHIVGSLRPSEGDNEHSVEWVGHGVLMCGRVKGRPAFGLGNCAEPASIIAI